MVITAQQRTSKGLPALVENSRMPGFVALSCTAGNQQHPTTAAPAKTGATRIPRAVSLPSGQYHYLVKSEKVMRIFCPFPEKVLGDSATTTRRKTRKEIITLRRMVHHITARHLPESGAGLRYLHERLGHKSSKMTEIYTHVSMKSLSNTKNLTDDFDNKIKTINGVNSKTHSEIMLNRGGFINELAPKVKHSVI